MPERIRASSPAARRASAAGKLKLLAIYNTRRYPVIPGVPTVSEEIPGYVPHISGHPSRPS